MSGMHHALNYLYSHFYCNSPSIYSQIIYHIVSVALAVALGVYLCLEIIYWETISLFYHISVYILCRETFSPLHNRI